jgi:hypothetical protein
MNIIGKCEILLVVAMVTAVSSQTGSLVSSDQALKVGPEQPIRCARWLMRRRERIARST